MISRLLLAALALVFLIPPTPAEARRRTPGAEALCTPTNDVMRPCAYNPNFLAGVRSIKVQMRRETRSDWQDGLRRRSPQRVVRAERRVAAVQRAPRALESRVERVYRTAGATYLAHPAGCPRSAFCGCGAAVELGLRDRSLWLARSWYKFPRTIPAPGTVGVRPHHVFVLKQHVGGSHWLVADYNSGGRLSRLHVRSIAGYTIVKPTG